MKGKGKRAELWCLTVLLAAMEVAGHGCWRWLGHGGAQCFAFIFLLSLLCFFSVFFSLSFSFLFSLLCYVFFSFFSFGLPPFFLVFLFFGALPCIYRKNRGERGRGGHCAAAPKTARRACSLLFHRPVVGHRSEVIHMELWLASFLCFLKEEGEKSR